MEIINQELEKKKKTNVKDKDRKLLTLIIGINPGMSRVLYLITFIHGLIMWIIKIKE